MDLYEFLSFFPFSIYIYVEIAVSTNIKPSIIPNYIKVPIKFMLFIKFRPPMTIGTD